MGALRDNKDVIELGAKLELAGRTEVASELYLTYVKTLAVTDGGQDVLEWLYGPKVYQNSPARYTVALEWGFIAQAAAALYAVVCARFPSADWTVEPGRVDSAVSDFFAWQSGASFPRSDDWEHITRMKAYLEKKDKVVLARSSTASRKTLENAIKSVGAGKTRYEDGKLY